MGIPKPLSIPRTRWFLYCYIRNQLIWEPNMGAHPCCVLQGHVLTSLSSIVSIISYYTICLPTPVRRSPGNTTERALWKAVTFHCQTRKSRTAVLIISAFGGWLPDLSKHRTSVWDRLGVEKPHAVKSAFLPMNADSWGSFPVGLGSFWVTSQKHLWNLVNIDI